MIICPKNVRISRDNCQKNMFSRFFLWESGVNVPLLPAVSNVYGQSAWTTQPAVSDLVLESSEKSVCYIAVQVSYYVKRFWGRPASLLVSQGLDKTSQVPRAAAYRAAVVVHLVDGGRPATSQYQRRGDPGRRLGDAHWRQQQSEQTVRSAASHVTPLDWPARRYSDKITSSSSSSSASASFICSTSTAARSCRDPGTAVIHCWLPGCVRRRPQRVTSAGSGGGCDTLRPPPLLLRPGAAVTAAAAAGAAAAAAV